MNGIPVEREAPYPPRFLQALTRCCAWHAGGHPDRTPGHPRASPTARRGHQPHPDQEPERGLTVVRAPVGADGPGTKPGKAALN